MTYIISKYDINDDWGKDGDWEEVARVKSPWAMRPILRDLRSRGYCNMSIAVDSDNPETGWLAPITEKVEP